VSVSGFYAWAGRAPSSRVRRDRHLTGLIRASFTGRRQRYGSPRIHADLRDQGECVSRKRVIRLMQGDGLRARARKRFKCTTMSEHNQPVAANLLDRQFTAERANHRWAERTAQAKRWKTCEGGRPKSSGHGATSSSYFS
jgi:putative transposase